MYVTYGNEEVTVVIKRTDMMNLPGKIVPTGFCLLLPIHLIVEETCRARPLGQSTKICLAAPYFGVVPCCTSVFELPYAEKSCSPELYCIGCTMRGGNPQRGSCPDMNVEPSAGKRE